MKWDWDDVSATGHPYVVRRPRPRTGRFPVTLAFVGAAVRTRWMAWILAAHRRECGRFGHRWQPLRPALHVDDRGMVITLRHICPWCGERVTQEHPLRTMVVVSQAIPVDEEGDRS